MKKQRTIYLGNNTINTKQHGVSGGFMDLNGEKWYQIRNCHEMPDFFISIVSDSDHWMYISSNGALSAGRKDRDNALFPYYTDDKIHDYKGKTGSSSCFIVRQEDKSYLWEPFTDDSLRFYNCTRNIYKNVFGNKIIFEEINPFLGLSFRYSWMNSERFGFVKESTLINATGSTISIELVDGLKNILPYGVTYAFQNEYSNLADAYKKNEKSEDSCLGLFMLSAIPVDRAEPSEALFATTVWTTGLGEDVNILVSDRQIGQFKKGESVENEYNIRAARGAYFVNTQIELPANASRHWFLLAEINQSSTQVVDLNQFILNTRKPEELIRADIAKGTENLKRMVSLADGFQLTNTEICTARHYTNVLFNIMRGGIFIDNYQVDKNDFARYVAKRNRLLSKEFQQWINKLPSPLSYDELFQFAKETNDTDLIRIASEYLPLTFSRRHGDPSRPWNQFSIETKNPDGSVKYNYEGNWRDIFQNWEALCYSFPAFTEGIISKFVNASTIDGYNPYRIMRNGIDWEVPEPDDPWAYIGYWGDHQIIYLQKMLELSVKFHPGKLDSMLTNAYFTYANVPYRIKPYEEILRNPKDTVVFDFELNNSIKTEAAYLGADAFMLKSKQGAKLYKVNLTEKILVTLLSKLSNFVPEAGIWLNTQRPEWNDANNALVGNGSSMVTLYYMRRFLKFWDEKLSQVAFSSVSISEEVATLLDHVQRFMDENVQLLEKGFTAADRLRFADFLGKAHTKYREEIYKHAFSGEKRKVQVKNLVSFFRLCLRYMDQSIRANKRSDNLYHAYNLITIKPGGIDIRHLYEMLEGQVAVLSSGLLNSKESLDVMNALKKSSMFRPDQYSYLLYPDRILPGFFEKNWVPEHLVESSALLNKLLQDKNDAIIQQDALGEYHFNSNFRNADVLEEALNDLKSVGYSHLIEEEKEKILTVYEEVFDHQSFTGRSGTFFGYEGLGSIYWHMVSKLLLAVQECFFEAVASGAGQSVTGQLKAHYYEIKAGIGLYKNPALYGGFPTDAHSHTPGNAGAKQPGLTGQVKEDIIARIGEMALKIHKGQIHFDAALINEDEILEQDKLFFFLNHKGEQKQLALKKGQMGFTCCLTPVVLIFSDRNQIAVYYADGSMEEIAGLVINQRISSLIFSRNDEVERIEVCLKKNNQPK